MKYIPEHRYQGNLYTNGGEFVYLNSSLPYVGSYHALSTGKFFTGATPYIDSSEEIVRQGSVDTAEANYYAKSNLNPTIVVGDIVDLDTSIFPQELILENSLQRTSNYLTFFNVDPNITYLTPVSYTPQPTTEDYQNGSFIRYMLYNFIDKIYLEVDKSTYENISKQSPSWDYEKYSAFKLPWKITGTQEDILKTNSQVLLVTSQQNHLPDLELYLVDLLKFSNIVLPKQEFTYTVTYNSLS